MSDSQLSGDAEVALPRPPSVLRIIILGCLALALEWLCSSGQVWLLLQALVSVAARKGGWRGAVVFFCSFLEKKKTREQRRGEGRSLTCLMYVPRGYPRPHMTIVQSSDWVSFSLAGGGVGSCEGRLKPSWPPRIHP